MSNDSSKNNEEKEIDKDKEGEEKDPKQSTLNDQDLASLFDIANEKTVLYGEPVLDSIFVDKKEDYEAISQIPDEDFLREIDDSIDRKEIHHKKLLEENAATNLFSKFFEKFKEIFSSSGVSKDNINLSSESWNLFSFFLKLQNKKIWSYISSFSSLIDIYLRNKDKSKKILKYEMISMSLLMFLSIFMLLLFSNTNDSDSFVYYSKFILFTSTISFIFTIIPMFFFISLWFVNINYIHESKNFHLFVFISFTIAAAFVVFSLLNSGLFYIVKNYGI